jgi:toxin ParE1/3/4
VARFRLSRPAQADLEQILATSRERWGDNARQRYASLLAAAMRQVAEDPEGPVTRNRKDLLPGVRSFHLRHTRRDRREESVRQPVHVVYYRAALPGVIEIVRVQHERMEPSRYLDAALNDPDE